MVIPCKGSFGQPTNDTTVTTSATTTSTQSEFTTSSTTSSSAGGTSSVFEPGRFGVCPEGKVCADTTFVVTGSCLVCGVDLLRLGLLIPSLQRSATLLAILSITESVGTYLFLFGLLKYAPVNGVVFIFGYRIVGVLRRLIEVCRSKPPKDVYFRKKHYSKDDLDRSKVLEAVSVYTDVNNSFLSCVAIFLVQIILYMYVVIDVWYQYPIVEEQERNFFLGACVGTVLRLELEGSFFSEEFIPFWCPFFKAKGFEGCIRNAAGLRFIMSVVVNEVFANAVVGLLPAILMGSSSNMEFVKDATCFAFISQLDNYATGPTVVELDKEDGNSC